MDAQKRILIDVKNLLKLVSFYDFKTASASVTLLVARRTNNRKVVGSNLLK